MPGVLGLVEQRKQRRTAAGQVQAAGNMRRQCLGQVPQPPVCPESPRTQVVDQRLVQFARREPIQPRHFLASRRTVLRTPPGVHLRRMTGPVRQEQHHPSGPREGHRPDALAAPLDHRCRQVKEERHIAAQRRTEPRQVRSAQRHVPHPAQQPQRRRRIARTSPQPGTGRDGLLQPDFRPRSDTGMRRQALRRLPYQVAPISRNDRRLDGQGDLPSRPRPDVHRVAQVHRHDQRANLVVTVAAPP